MRSLAVISLLCGTLGAQSFVTAPPGFLTVEGRSYSYLFGGHSWARHMQFDGTWRGESVTEHGRCPQRYDVDVTIKDGRISGQMVSRNRTLTVGSRVDPGGRVDQVFAYNGRTILKIMSGRLGANRGQLSWMGHGLEEYKLRGAACRGTITLERTGAP